jgi:antitoxin MazE
MKANIIQIGNSRGIRIPKVILEQTRLGKEVELEVEDQRIVIYPLARPRQGWDKQFKLMAENNEDRLIHEDVSMANQFDQGEWEW